MNHGIPHCHDTGGHLNISEPPHEPLTKSELVAVASDHADTTNWGGAWIQTFQLQQIFWSHAKKLQKIATIFSYGRSLLRSVAAVIKIRILEISINQHEPASGSSGSSGNSTNLSFKLIVRACRMVQPFLICRRACKASKKNPHHI